MSAVRPNVAAEWAKVTQQLPQKMYVLLSCKPRQHFFQFCHPKAKRLIAVFLKASYRSSLIRNFYQETLHLVTPGGFIGKSHFFRTYSDNLFMLPDT